MHLGSALLVLWLIVGAVAAGQSGVPKQARAASVMN